MSTLFNQQNDHCVMPLEVQWRWPSMMMDFGNKWILSTWLNRSWRLYESWVETHLQWPRLGSEWIIWRNMCSVYRTPFSAYSHPWLHAWKPNSWGRGIWCSLIFTMQAHCWTSLWWMSWRYKITAMLYMH